MLFTRRNRIVACFIGVLVVAPAPAYGQTPATQPVLKGSVTTKGTTRAPDFCGSMDPANYPNENPKTTRPFCASQQSTTGCDAPPNWPDAANWKILERQGVRCLVAAPRTPQDRERLADRVIVQARAITSVYRQCEKSPWDPSKLLCEEPPSQPQAPLRGGAGDGAPGPCTNATNYYYCGPSGGPPLPTRPGRQPVVPMPVPATGPVPGQPLNPNELRRPQLPAFPKADTTCGSDVNSEDARYKREIAGLQAFNAKYRSQYPNMESEYEQLYTQANVHHHECEAQIAAQPAAPKIRKYSGSFSCDARNCKFLDSLGGTWVAPRVKETYDGTYDVDPQTFQIRLVNAGFYHATVSYRARSVVPGRPFVIPGDAELLTHAPR